MKFFKHPMGVHRHWMSKSLPICKLALAGLVLINMQATAATALKTTNNLNFNTKINIAKITGKVVDEKGEPLIGVSVRIKGTTTGTQTDTRGNFTVDATPQTVLVISYIGFTTQEVTVGSRTSLTITLVSNNNLNEVVVT